MHKHILTSYTLMASSPGSCTCVDVPRHMSLRLREPALPALARPSLASGSPQQPPRASCTLCSFPLMAWPGLQLRRVLAREAGVWTEPGLALLPQDTGEAQSRSKTAVSPAPGCGVAWEMRHMSESGASLDLPLQEMGGPPNPEPLLAGWDRPLPPSCGQM